MSILLKIVQGVDKNQLLLANSRNYISILLLSTMLLYYISCLDKKKSVSILPAIIYLFINMYATGRAGIIVAIFLLIGVLFYKYISVRRKNVKILIGFLGIISIFALCVYILNLDNAIILRLINTKFSAFAQRGYDSNGRFEIWSTFVNNNNKSIGDFLFGSDATLAMGDGNLHNSFLQCYASFGILGFVLVIALTIRAFFGGIHKKAFFWLILFGGFILRAVTDRVFFQGYCEVYLYYFLFYESYWKKREAKRRKYNE